MASELDEGWGRRSPSVQGARRPYKPLAVEQFASVGTRANSLTASELHGERGGQPANWAGADGPGQGSGVQARRRQEALAVAADLGLAAGLQEGRLAVLENESVLALGDTDLTAGGKQYPASALVREWGRFFLQIYEELLI